MSIARKIGISIFCGVPVIIGGGIVYALFGDSLNAMYIYEIMLFFALGGFISRR